MGFSEQLGPALTNMIADAGSAGFDISITSGYRSPESQADIIARNMHKFGFSDSDRDSWRADVAEYGAVGAGNRWTDRFTSATRVVGGEGERGTPMRNWIALPGSSKHQTGNAADLAYGSPEARNWAHENAGTYGLHFRLGNEPWHIEPINISGHSPNSAPHDHTPTVDVAQLSHDTNEQHANRAGDVETTQNQAASNAMNEATDSADDEQDTDVGPEYVEDKVIAQSVSEPINNQLRAQIDRVADQFLSSLTQEQKMIEGVQYANAKRNSGESANFNDWFKANRFNGYLAAYLARDRSTLGELSQQQQQLLANATQLNNDMPSYSSSVMGLS